MSALLTAAKAFLAELDSSGDFANWQRCKALLREAVAAEESSGLERVRTLVLSTAHISQETMERIENDALACSSWSGEFGGVVSVNGYDPNNTYFIERTPADLFNVVKFAHLQGCSYVVFDRDGDEVEGLPTFDW